MDDPSPPSPPPLSTPEVTPLPSLVLLQLPAALNDALKPAVLGAVVLGIISLLVWLRRRKQESGPATVLFVGAPDSGKTALFSQLSLSTLPATRTSSAPNESHVSLPTQTSKTPSGIALHLVDIPGHPRIRSTTFSDYLPGARGLVFVVEGPGISRTVSQAGEHLHLVLRSLARRVHATSKPAPRLLVAVSKVDLSAKGGAPPAPAPLVARVKAALAAELGRRRAAHRAGAAVEGLGAVVDEKGGVGKGGEDEKEEEDGWGGDGLGGDPKDGFSWEALERDGDVQVDWVGTWVSSNGDEEGVAELKDWLVSL